jgi:hypothetical protein
MAVLYGDKMPDGWVRTSCIQYMQESDPNGFTIEHNKMPPYPDPEPGLGWVQFYNPETNEWRYDPIKVPYTTEQAILEVAAALREVSKALKAR